MRRLNWKTAARIIISAGLLIWLVSLIDWKDLTRVLSTVQLQWIMLAIIWIIISMVISTKKWQLVLDAQGIFIPVKELWKSYWAGLFFNNFLPSSIGGDALRIWWIGRTTRDNPGAAVSVVVERILATIGLAVTGLVAAVFVNHPDSRALTLFVVLIMVSLVLLGLICSDVLTRRTEPAQGNRLFCFLRGMALHGKTLRRQPGQLIKAGLLSVVFQLTVVAVNFCIFQALNITGLTGWDLVYVIPVISVAAMLPLGINGYGIREGAYVVLLGLYNVPTSTAFSASLLFVFLVSLCSLYGGYTFYNHRSKGEVADVRIQSFTVSSGRDEAGE